MELPKVNQELCTGCEACIDMCPMETIVIEDGKAYIVEENCSGCRACIMACPVEAIS